MCEGILRSGLGFGAKRWISILKLHRRRSAAAISWIVPWSRLWGNQCI